MSSIIGLIKSPYLPSRKSFVFNQEVALIDFGLQEVLVGSSAVIRLKNNSLGTHIQDFAKSK